LGSLIAIVGCGEEVSASSNEGNAKQDAGPRVVHEIDWAAVEEFRLRFFAQKWLAAQLPVAVDEDAEYFRQLFNDVHLIAGCEVESGEPIIIVLGTVSVRTGDRNTYEQMFEWLCKHVSAPYPVLNKVSFLENYTE
jgi:hypothetical protein